LMFIRILIIIMCRFALIQFSPCLYLYFLDSVIPLVILSVQNFCILDIFDVFYLEDNCFDGINFYSAQQLSQMKCQPFLHKKENKCLFSMVALDLFEVIYI
ncbi:hypothetical protein ACJX0J_040402, partial [Zea mays]